MGRRMFVAVVPPADVREDLAEFLDPREGLRWTPVDRLHLTLRFDAERGKPIELDALVTAVHELGRRTGVATPFIDGLLGITRLFAQTRGLLSG